MRKLGPYSLEERIGQGGMAQVFRARLEGPAGFEKEVVIKTIRPHLAAEPAFVERFLDEARISARLQHRNIVQVHHFGLEEGVPFLVMERLDGLTLAQLVAAARARGRFIPVGAAVTIVRELCAALGYVHEFDDGSSLQHSIVHGDVTPSNVMVCKDGSVKLIDFGVARIGGRKARFRSDAVVGKCGYLAPEQVKLEPQDARVDVFSAGIVLHELLGGRRLFAGATESATLRLIDQCDVPAPSRLNPAVPAALDAIVLRALARDPEHRFANGGRLGAALDDLGDAVSSWPRSKLAAFARELSASVPAETESRPEAVPEVQLRHRAPAVTAIAAPTRVSVAPPARPRRPRHPLIVGAALLAACVLAALPLGSVDVGAAEHVALPMPAAQAAPIAPVALPAESELLPPPPVVAMPDIEEEEEPPAPPPPPRRVKAERPTSHHTHASRHHRHHKHHVTLASRAVPSRAVREGAIVDPFTNDRR